MRQVRGRRWRCGVGETDELVNIRKFVVRATHLEDLVQLGTLSAQAARFLEAAVSSGLNILVSGGTQVGKATLLNCLTSAIPTSERVVTAEEVFELKNPRLSLMSGVPAATGSRAISGIPAQCDGCR